MNEALQWLGFVAVLVGYALYSKRPRAGAAVTVIGAGSLAAWCALQPVIPLGVLAVQLSALTINLFNATKRSHT